MSTITNKTLSVMLVLGLIIGGIPLFFSATDNAEAAYSVHEKRSNAFSLTDSHGYLNVNVMTFEDEGNKPIQGFTMLLTWDLCRKDLNPLSGFWRTIRAPDHEIITTDAKGEASFKYSIPNGCWTENAWLYCTAEGWQNPEYFLGNMASTKLELTIRTQPSGETIHQIARADTLGLIQDWYEMVPYESETTSPSEVVVHGSKTYAGSAKMSVTSLVGHDANLATVSKPLAAASAIASHGTIADYAIRGSFTPYILSNTNSVGGTWTDSNIKTVFGDGATLTMTSPGTSGSFTVNSNSAANPDTWTISNASVNGPKMIFSVYNDGFSSTGFKDTSFRISVNGVVVYPSTGGWYNPTGAQGTIVDMEVPLPWDPTTDSTVDIQISAYKKAGTNPSIRSLLAVPWTAEFILSSLTESSTSTVLSIIDGRTLTVDLTGHWGDWQIGGMSSTLTSEDLVPVNAKISSVYPLVISSPRFDKTPIAGTGNGLKFDVYNIKDQATHETIYLSLIADGTTVWSTTVGQREYPAWTNASQYTSVHLTDITFPAEPRREYDLQITSGGAITKIPVVFYPSELDPEEIYGPKDELDKIIKDYGTVNARALKAYHDWAVSMQPKVEAIKADVENYTKLFEDRTALDNLALADAAATRGLDLIADLKEICKGDGSGTSIGELTSHAQGIWSSYLAALLYRETAIAYEAGQPAFGNSTALDAWYADLLSKRIKTGLDDPGGYDDPNSVAVWVAVAVALVVGGLVMYLCWKYIIPPLKRVLPKGRSPRLRTIRALTPVAVTIVLAVLIALVAFLATWNIAVNIEAALR